MYGHFSRGEASQVRRLRQSVQPIIESDHPLTQAHRLQALRLRPVRPGLPAQGRPAPPPREPTRRPLPTGSGSGPAASTATGSRPGRTAPGGRIAIARVALGRPSTRVTTITFFGLIYIFSDAFSEILVNSCQFSSIQMVNINSKGNFWLPSGRKHLCFHMN